MPSLLTVFIIAAIAFLSLAVCCASVTRGYERNMPVSRMGTTDRDEYERLKSMFPSPRSQPECAESLFGDSAGHGCEQLR